MSTAAMGVGLTRVREEEMAKFRDAAKNLGVDPRRELLCRIVAAHVKK
jgi:hypothetical protein